MLLALRNLTRRRLRTGLTLLGVAVGMSGVVALIGVADGAEGQMDRAIRMQRGDIILFARGARLWGRLKPEDLEAVAKVEGVARAAPYDVLPEVLVAADRAGGNSERMAVLAFPDPGLLERRFGLAAGRAPAPGAGEAIVGKRAAEFLGVSVGDRVLVRDRPLEVVGIYATGVSFQDRGVVLHFDLAREIFNLGSSARLAMADVSAPDGGDEEKRRVAKQINETVPAVEAIPAPDVVNSWEDRKILQALTWAISFIAVLVGGIGVLNTMTMSVSERTREIGLFLAVGWRAGKVLRLILAEGALLSLAGGLLGFPLGVLWVEGASRLVPQFPIEGAFGPVLFAEAVALSLAVGLAGSLVPAWTASRLDPMEALRYE
ncbi:MAG: ABC transporter permease [Planctomycetales bacterium]|nr:ABC transporter permease [Planctomycetales bacterium]